MGCSVASTLTAASLNNTGNITISGSSTKLASLVVAGPAGLGTTGVLSGSVTLAGDALLQFGSGQINTIASGGTLFMDSPAEHVADASDTSSNSALTGLSSIAGRLFLRNGVSVSPSGNLSVSGELHVDDGFGNGGTSLSVPGTLTSSNFVQIGNGGLSAASTLTAASLNNTGNITISGSSTKLASLVVAGAAGLGTTGVLSGSVTLAGDALLQFGSGQINTIASGGTLFMDSPAEHVADASDTSSNSALTGLSSIAGRLFLRNGVSVSPSGNLSVSGELHVDDGFGNGGTSLSVPGTLTNSNFVQIGNSGLSAASTLTAASLNNTGNITISGSSTKLASLVVAGAAGLGTTGVLSGSVTLAGDALLQFGSGQINTIASGGTLFMDSPAEHVADASDTSSNSALTGLSSIAGRLFLRNGVSVSPSGNLSVSGELHVDDGFGNGGTSLSVPGTLTNSNFVQIGNSGLSAASTLTAASLNNTGNITISGSSTKLASLVVAGAAGLGTTGVLSGSVTLAGDALLQFGSGQINTIASGGTLFMDSPAEHVADASDTSSNSALTGLSSIAGAAVPAQWRIGEPERQSVGVGRTACGRWVWQRRHQPVGAGHTDQQQFCANRQ